MRIWEIQVKVRGDDDSEAIRFQHMEDDDSIPFAYAGEDVQSVAGDIRKVILKELSARKKREIDILDCEVSFFSEVSA